MPTFFTEVFNEPSSVGPLGLIVLDGAQKLGALVDRYLVKRAVLGGNMYRLS